ncbi:hypothetical protein Taro_035424 [Colocasia esculenta]|uniref:Uncharacterized protein n=1 Tax=Colocasia esculenta TaxID=4460 RepID=A0A843WEU8_COLES|nr:hypothetical protein [Colocasia esculenta]
MLVNFLCGLMRSYNVLVGRDTVESALPRLRSLMVGVFTFALNLRARKLGCVVVFVSCGGEDAAASRRRCCMLLTEGEDKDVLPLVQKGVSPLHPRERRNPTCPELPKALHRGQLASLGLWEEYKGDPQ